MFNQTLANKILERLDREFPTTMTLAQLADALTEFSDQPRSERFRAVDALEKSGLVGCRILRSGIDQIDDIGPIVITERGTREVNTIASSSKNGLFISHISEEKAAAQLLKDFLRATFGNDLKIFVSSDYESILGGTQWFNSIVDALRSAKVILVLLSEVSVEMRWINFEAGVGLGAQAPVVPLVYRKLAKGGIGPPLSVLHARSLHDPDDVRALAIEIQQGCGLEVKGLDPVHFVSELLQRERDLPAKHTLLTPYIIPPPHCLRFKLENAGNQDIELIMVEASVPKRYLDSTWQPMPYPNVLEVNNAPIDNEPYLTLKYNAFEGSMHPNFDTIERLPRFLAVGMPPLHLKWPIGFALRSDLKETDGVDVPIFYAVYAKGVRPEKSETTYRKLVMQI